ncbi:flagellar hook-basal body complex protein FliE [Rhodobacteraceae bacterium 2CG4]|uniref:Flagellar hook-basal body complex protein FliE n=1 Tax=Halovulum marinum TaxID=2662447 RepID=A0A6L5Z5T6_9RHOB|nr:flagellar hook-basal body complex protein FliE [Halovulum marinum]MSU91797.1 flagellar hook-basal body complex protein FliE [Halovulum marinum]
MTDLTATAAARAYASAQPATRPAEVPRAEAGDDHSFAALAGDFVKAMGEAENTVAAGLTGRADPQAVVEALAATEIAVQAAVAVRDKVVEAYQEILRMPV